MGGGTELIFVEGHSTDNTYATIETAINANPHRPSQLLRQEDKGKGDAICLGFKHASGDILLAFSWLLGRPIKDTLCGTKVLWKADYERIAANRSYFGDFDPFGDFDLLFSAVKLNLKIVEVPIRYRERTHGTANISRRKHGWLLLRTVCFAALRIKFV